MLYDNQQFIVFLHKMNVKSNQKYCLGSLTLSSVKPSQSIINTMMTITRPNPQATSDTYQSSDGLDAG